MFQEDQHTASIGLPGDDGNQDGEGDSDVDAL